jgi:hypothetical protein
MSKRKHLPHLQELMPEGGRILLTGTGKQFVERIGVDAVRTAILKVMMGENIRTQTEPLSRMRIAQISGALIVLFARGLHEVPDFIGHLSEIALSSMAGAKRNDIATLWTAQWLLGLTGKSVQNVLRSDPEALQAYVKGFEEAVHRAAHRCREEMGEVEMQLGYTLDEHGAVGKLDWEGITRLTTAIGSQTLTIRGSDKSLYGKLFERLILGSFLSIMGFERVDPKTNTKRQGVYWLSDSSELRECDATLIVKPGKVAKFDIGFIGPGNSEISKDKLSRFTVKEENVEFVGSSVTFIIVDRLPMTGRTEKAADAIGAEIVQMSMQYWVRDLAQRLGRRLGVRHELQTMDDAYIGPYLEENLSKIAIQDFLAGVATESTEPSI